MWGARGPFPLAVAMVVAVVMPAVCCCSVVRAQTTLVQLNPGILGIARKLLSLQEQFSHYTKAQT
jgi:hypothetical protein